MSRYNKKTVELIFMHCFHKVCIHVWAMKYKLCDGDFTYELNALMFAFKIVISQYIEGVKFILII